MASTYFTPTDFEKIASALAKKADGLAERLKTSLRSDAPNEYQADLFIQLVDALKAQKDALVVAKLGSHELLGSLLLRTGSTRDVSTTLDITNINDVPPMPKSE